MSYPARTEAERRRALEAYRAACAKLDGEREHEKMLLFSLRYGGPAGRKLDLPKRATEAEARAALEAYRTKFRGVL